MLCYVNYQYYYIIIAGLFLTKPEVRKDIREIQRTLNVDSDSDCSVREHHVIDCRNDYPVKPRKTPRWGSSMNRDSSGHMDYSRGRIDQVYYDYDVVETTMSYINNIKTNHPDLYEAEEERDRIDNMRQSLHTNIINESKRISFEKKEQEGYFRLLQGALMRSIMLQNSLVRNNAMSYDVLNTLKKRKEAIQTLESEIARLKTLNDGSSSSNSSNSNSNSKKGKKNDKSKDSSANANASASDKDGLHPPGSTSMLHVVVTDNSASTNSSGSTSNKKSKNNNNNNNNNSNNEVQKRDIYIYRGQSVETPMGLAIIEHIFPGQDKIVLQLPFGKMYSNLRRMLCWGSQTEIKLSQSVDFATNTNTNTVNAATFSNSSDNILKHAGEALDSASDKALLLRWGKLRHSLTVPSDVSRGIEALLGPQWSRPIIADDGNQEDGMDISAGSGGAALTPEPEHDDLEHDPENDNRLLYSISNAQDTKLGEDYMKSFFLTVDNKEAENNRKKLKTNLNECIGSNIPELCMVMAHPSALPYILDNKLLKKSQETLLCSTALSSTSMNRPGVTGTLTWDTTNSNNIMKNDLNSKGTSIQNVENEVFSALRDVSSSRRAAAKLAVHTSALRMAMFTRRVRHRNNLSDRGINGGPALATLDPATVEAARAAAGSNDPVAISQALHSIAAKAEEEREAKAAANRIGNGKNGKGGARSGEIVADDDDDDDDDEDDDDEDDNDENNNDPDNTASKKRPRPLDMNSLENGVDVDVDNSNSNAGEGENNGSTQSSSPTASASTSTYEEIQESLKLEDLGAVALLSTEAEVDVDVDVKEESEVAPVATKSKSKGKRKR
jgi:hypothetical protein